MSSTTAKLECLLHFNGSDTSTTITDDSANGLTITNNQGSYGYNSTDTSKFGSASGKLLNDRATFITEAHIWGSTTRNTTTTRIYGIALATNVEIYNVTRDAYSYVTGSGIDTISSPAPGSTKNYTDISPAITGQTTGDEIRYAGSDIRIPNTGSVLDLNGDFAITMWVKGDTPGTILDTRPSESSTSGYKITIESNATLKVKWGNSTTLITSTGTVSSSSFTYVALCRYGETLVLYVGDTKQTEYVGLLGSYTITDIQVGNNTAGSGAGFYGYIDEVQVWCGIPLFVASFPSTITLPSAEYADDFKAVVSSLNLQTEFTTSVLKVASLNLQTEFTTSVLKVASLNLQVEVIIPPGKIKRWDGEGWQPYPLKRWDGSAWTEVQVKRWDGSAWDV